MKPIKATHQWFLFLVANATLLFHSGLFAIGPEYSGSWYNPSQSGHGFSLEYTILNGTRVVVAYWYVYDSEGNPIFMLGQGEVPHEGNSVAMNFELPYGMKFGEFEPGDVVREYGGFGVFEFQDSENGVFHYEPSTWAIETHGVSFLTIPVVKLVGVALEEPSSVNSYVETYQGAWIGRMSYDRGSEGSCDDADLNLRVDRRSDRNAWRLTSITIIRDHGGQATFNWGFNDAIFSSFIGREISVFGESIDMNIQFPQIGSVGHAEGYWNYGSGACYGQWTFTKD